MKPTKQEEDKIFQEGYAKGRLRCLQQHYRKELEKMRKELIDKILKSDKCLPSIKEVLEKLKI